MTRATEADLGSLTAIKGEIDLALSLTADALAEKNQDETKKAQIAQTHLHQVHGALLIVGLDGVTQFTAAIDLLLAAIAKKNKKLDEATHALVLRSLSSVTNYLDELVHGAPDQPLRLMSIYSELLTVLGQKASPVDLFYPDLSIRLPRRESSLPEAGLMNELRTVRARFERALLDFLRNRNDKDRIKALRVYAVDVEKLQTAPLPRSLWWSAIAFFDSAIRGHASTEDCLRLSLQLDTQLRRSLSGNVSVPERLLREILYFVAAAPAKTRIQKAVKDTWHLDDLIPQPGTEVSQIPLAPLEEALYGPLTAAGETWGHFNAGQAPALKEFAQSLDRIEAPLRRIGRPTASRLLTGIHRFTEWLLKNPKRMSEAIGMEIASAMLLLEAAIDRSVPDAGFSDQVGSILQRLGILARGESLPEKTDGPDLTIARRGQEKEAIAQLSKEILNNLSNIEQTLDDFFRDQDKREPLLQLNPLMQQIEGALKLLGEDLAIQVVHESSQTIDKFAHERVPEAQAELEKLAHDLSALGFYIESLQHNRLDLQRLLHPEKYQTAQESVVEYVTEETSDEAPDFVVESEQIGTVTEIFALPTFEGDEELLPEPNPQIVDPVEPVPEPTEETRKLMDASDEEVDAELLNIFIEEAHEVLANLQDQLAISRNSPADMEALTAIRRGFHTLKGSGRMVGLREMGEAAWGIEQTLNRWLQLEWHPTPELHAMLDDAHTLFVQWVSRMEAGEGHDAPDTEAEARLLATANHLRSIESPAETLSIAPESTPDIPEPDTAAETSILEEEEPQTQPLPADNLTAGSMSETVLTDINLQASPSEVFDETGEELLEAFDFAEESIHPQEVEEIVFDATPETEVAPQIDTEFISLESEDGLTETSLELLPEDEPTLILDQKKAEFDAESSNDESSFESFRLEDDLIAEPVQELTPVEPAPEPQERSAFELQLPEEEDLLPTEIQDFEAPKVETSADLDLSIEEKETALAAEAEKVPLEPAEAPASEVPESASAQENDLPWSSFETPAADVVESPVETETDILQGELTESVPDFFEPTEISFEETPALTLEEISPVTPLRETDAPQPQEEVAGPDEIEKEIPVEPEPLPTEPAVETMVRIGETELPPTLFALFISEAQQHLGNLHQGFSEMQTNPTLQVSEVLSRSAHTLAGIAGTAKIAPMQTLARSLEYALHRQQAAEASPNTEALNLFIAATDTLDTMIADVTAFKFPLAVPEMEALLDSTLQTPKEEPVPEKQPSYPPETPAEPEPEPETPPIQDEVDESLLPIFLEESADLMGQMRATLRVWKAEPDEEAHAQAIARLLHTLKGSARMTGAMRLGDFTHQLESRFLSAQKSRQPVNTIVDETDLALDHAESLINTLATGETSQEETPAAGPAQAEQIILPEAETSSGTLRVKAELLDNFVNNAGEIGIARTRIEGELRTLRHSLLDLTENVIRLRNQLREVEIQAEVQMQSRIALAEAAHGEFDPLEMDRYTRLQELTRMMAESVNDVTTVQQSLLRNLDGADIALHSQARLSRELQQALMRVRMVPFSNLADRLYRVVRQGSKDLGKRANLDITGGRIEMDRSVLEHMMAPFEHLLRNAIAHGIETPQERLAAGKPEVGQIDITVTQEGNELAIDISDDGRGLNFSRIIEIARNRGWLKADEIPDERHLADFIFQSGFTTADKLSAVSGRGVGMDVVKTETAAVGGRIQVQSSPGKGTTFRIYLPLTLAVTQALLVRAGGHSYAIPSSLVAQVLELKQDAFERVQRERTIVWMNEKFSYRYLPRLLGDKSSMPEEQRYNWILLLRSAEQNLAIHVDSLRSNQEIVIKTAGPQLSRLVGMSGATVMPDGEIVLIINPVALASRMPQWFEEELPFSGQPEQLQQPERQPVVMVVDDSLTVRKITGRMLEREGYRVVTAKDGIDALEQLTEFLPDVILSDIEMPRMDGFDLLRSIRADARMHDIPVIMITSRLADKHRQYATELGANHYLGKPFAEDELFALLKEYTAALRH